MPSLSQTLQKLFKKARRTALAPRARLHLEELESRELLSGFTLANNGTLTQGGKAVDTNVATFATDNAGNLFELKCNGNVWERTAITNTWAQLDTNVGSFQANSAGQLEEVKTSGRLWDRSAAGMWTRLSDNVDTAGIDAGGNVYFLKNDATLREWAASSATTSSLESSVVSFQMGGTGNDMVYCLTSNQHIYYVNNNLDVTNALDSGGQNQFVLNFTDYAVGSDGSLYLSVYDKSKNSNDLIRYTPGESAPDVFDPLGAKGLVVSLQLTGDRSMLYYEYVNETSNTVGLWRYKVSDGSFTNLLTAYLGTPTTEQLGQLYVGGDDAAYVIDIKYTGTTAYNYSLFGAASSASTAILLVSAVSPPQANPVALAPNGNLFVLDKSGTVWNFNIATPAGSAIDNNVVQMVVAPNGAFYEGKANGKFWTWTESNNWTLLDSNLASFAVGGNGVLYEQTKSGNLWTLQNSAWTLIDRNVTQFALAQDGAMVYDSNGLIYLWTPSIYNPAGPYCPASQQTEIFISDLDLLTTTGSVPGVTNLPV
jgi:hypothetical protein